MAYNFVTFGLLESDVVGLTDEQRTAVELQLTVSIVNESTWLYKNFRHPRFENCYGYAQIMSGAYVVKDIQINYLNQQLFFREYDTYDIDDNIGCAVRAILGALTPPKEVMISVRTNRTSITSVRFRFFPGIAANVGIRWITPESNCGNAVNAPDKRQGQPIAPNNGTSDPGSRPPGQGGDSADPSGNDGSYDPGSGLPPAPGTGGGAPIWHGFFKTTIDPPTCRVIDIIQPYADATDPTATLSFQITQPNGFCSDSNDGNILYNGANIGAATGVRSVSFVFY